MKILLAAGVFFPDVGGPAIHVRKIAERLALEGFKVQVVAYGDNPNNTDLGFPVLRVSRKQPKILQWLKYSFAILRHSLNSDILYGFDPTAAGIPPALMALFLRKPYILRIGGDPIWEREAEMGRRLMPLSSYYNQKLYKKDNPFLYFIIKAILKIPRTVVVYNQNFKDFYIKYFDISPEKIMIIKNPAFKRESASLELPSEPAVLFAGRFVAYKNLEMVVKAFKNVGTGRLVLIGSGPEEHKLHSQGVEILKPMPQEKLFEHIKDSAICIGPALSEFNPNFILEALSFGKPVILSRGHGLSVDLPEEFLFDPLDQKELENKLRALLEPGNYRKAVEKVGSLALNQSWEDVTSAHLDIIKTCIKTD